MPNNPRSGLKARSKGSHFGPPTAPNSIESQSFATFIVSSGRGVPASSYATPPISPSTRFIPIE